MTREEIVGMSQEEFISWVWVPVRKIVWKTCQAMNFKDWEDNLSETLLEVDAKRHTFDPDISSWNTFLYNAARFKCMHLCRDKSADPGYLQEFWIRANRMEAASGELTDKELSERMGVPVETVMRRRILRRVTQSFEDVPGFEWVADPRKTDTMAMHRVALWLLREGIKTLTPRQQETITVLLRTDSCTEAAQLLGVSINNVCHHRKRIVKKLRWELRNHKELMLEAVG